MKNFIKCLPIAMTSVLALYASSANAGLEIFQAHNINFCVHMEGAYANAQRGTNIHLWSCNNNTGSDWEWMDDDAYLTGRIRLAGTDLCITKKGSDSASNGDNVHLWSCGSSGNSNNQWNWEGGVDKLTLTGSNQCLQKQGTDSPSNGDNIHLWNCNTGASQNKLWSGMVR